MRRLLEQCRRIQTIQHKYYVQGMILGTPAVARAALLGSLLLSVNSHTWPTHSSKLKLKRLIDVRAVGLWAHVR